MATQPMTAGDEQPREAGNTGPPRSEEVNVFRQAREKPPDGIPFLVGCCVWRDHVSSLT
jgi:hypothetical protein